MSIFKTSTISGEGIHEGIYWLIDAIVGNKPFPLIIGTAVFGFLFKFFYPLTTISIHYGLLTKVISDIKI